MTSFHFRPSARLQRYLGRELIADPNLAIIEFVKNAYDANAQNVWVVFLLADPNNRTLIVADDGDGMDVASFEQNWMHPGYSEKSPEAAVNQNSDRVTRSGRVPVGEKGLGRLAAGRLGTSLEVYTRNSSKQPWLHVDFNWADFEDMTKFIDAIPIQYDLKTNPIEPLVQRGTILLIKNLELNWDGRVRGRPIPGRSRTRLGRLKQDLKLLIRPLVSGDTKFTIHLDSDSIINADDVGKITPEAAVTDAAAYVYDFAYSRTREGDIRVKRSLARSDAIVNDFGGAPLQQFTEEALVDFEAGYEPLSCGKFTGRFLYTPPPAAKRAREIDAIGSGVLLYRDGVMVEPYGVEDNDWVGVSARKAQRQGYALIQPNLFSGYVLITRDQNPHLLDMSNREGLLETEISEEFIRHVQAEFSFFEGEVFEELSQRWEPVSEKAAKQSEESIDFAAVRLRAIAHSLGQPFLGLDADLSSIRYLTSVGDLPPNVSERMLILVDSAAEHLETAKQALGRFRDVPKSERVAVSSLEIMGEVDRKSSLLAQSLGVDLTLSEVPDMKLIIHGELVVEALTELIRNALEASRPADRTALVLVLCTEEGGDLAISITDNGNGIPGATSGMELSLVPSSKGRPGMGLATVCEILSASRGRIELAKSDSNGTRIQVLLPTRLKGVA